MKRRDFLAGSAAAAGLALAGCDSAAPPPARKRGDPIRWRNWSGYQSCLPAQRIAPESLDQLVDLLRKAPGPVRPVGAGHSFTPLVPTDGTLLSLRNFTGLLRHDAKAMTATFGAGTKLGQVGGPLQGIGQALPNMPDVDEQSLAGAIGTGTHGTGATLGAMHSYVTALQLVTPRGEVLECSAAKHREIFDAARVSLGSLGVITEVTLQNLPTHNLKRRLWLEPLDALLERFDALAAKHHSFEIYLIPHCDSGIAITIDPTDEPVHPRGVDQDNNAVLDMKTLRDFTSWAPSLRRWLMNRATADFQPEEAVDVWYKVFPSSRAVRFNEMEYHLPREHLVPTVRRVREAVEKMHPEIFFPIEVRIVKGAGDDALLSPFHGHATSGSIAVHHYYPEDPLPYFGTIEPLYQNLGDFGGRPHWGKMHTLSKAQLAQRYPRFQEFLDIRATLDPEGRMLNAHLKTLFGA
ncbi:MAG TPA: D-arabinono-1,4-lactone oxidase [Verrucomicrobiae bacterium]|nr:D-arabinono-1,4-lactone oxidase [Verrucomicrobiae bacterium]